MDVIDNIKKISVERGYSHEAMAMDLGISQTAYSKLESGKTKLSVDRLLKIAEILEVSTAQLLNDEPSIQQNIHNNETVTAIGHQKIENLYQENKETYEKLLQAKDEQILLLRKMLKLE